MRNILKESYIPFGSQYYRAPSPSRNEWENDLKNMADNGFNTVKFWVQWRWNQPSEDRFCFDDIDELMDLAERFRLKVMLNTIFDVAPAWIYHKFPDASMVTLSGRKIGPQTQPHRQIGGLGYCFNHDGVMQHFFQFLAETVKRYTNHPALAIWNVGSEPELTSSMAEMREYADDASKMGDMLCYCDNCRVKFRNWLELKYQTIERLNISWNRNYTSFEEIELPLTRNTFNDIIDWRMFFVATLGENVRKRFEVAKAIDQGRHPLMCHHVFIQGFPVTSTASDPWNVGRFGDLHGFTQMDDPAMIDVLRSCAKGKPVISAEMLMLNGYTLDLPRSIDINDVKRFIFSGIAGNLKGFIFWQYRPEILGREAPTWGLTTLDGEKTSWLQDFARVGQVLQKNADFLLEAQPQSAEIAISYNPENQIFIWAATGNEKNATNSLLGAHKALYEHNYNIDFVHPIEIDEKLLSRYKVLIFPFPYLIDQRICHLLEDWVKKGGLLIGESYFAAWNRENGHHEKIVPGYGLPKIFKARQGVVDPVNTNDLVNILVDSDVLDSGKEITVKGAIVQERLIPEGAKVIGHFCDGSPAITLAELGLGKAVLIGSYIALPFYNKGIQANGDFLAGLIKKYANISTNYCDSLGQIRVDLLKNESGQMMLILRNLTETAINTEIHICGLIPKHLAEQFSAETLNVVYQDNDSSFNITLNPKEVKVYFGEIF